MSQEPYNAVQAGPTSVGIADDEMPLLDLQPGQIQLYSYHRPSLEAGAYRVSVDHVLSSAGENDLPLHSEKRFRVLAPRFVLPPTDIHSTYPHQGHGELAKVLPHVVLADPHLPWERAVEDPEGDAQRELHNQPAARMPWLGVLPFEIEELHVSNGPATLMAMNQTSDMSYKMPLSTLWAMKDAIAQPFGNEEMAKLDISRPDGEKATDNISVILLKPELFQKLFTKQQGTLPTDPKQISLDRFKHLAHVRIVHSQGLAQAGGGVANPGRNEEFSVVVSPRSGPTRILGSEPAAAQRPIPMIAHLISLEGIQEHITLPSLAGKKFVAIPTLHSWSYESLPPDHVDYDHLMNCLVNGSQPFRLDSSLIESMTKSITEAPLPPENDGDQEQEISFRKIQAEWLDRRLRNGFSFIKYCAGTGEETTALYSGPLRPLGSKMLEMDECSVNQSSSLQIIDHLSGLPDLSYSLAWELGQALASSDRDFTAAIMRLRSGIQASAKVAYHEQYTKWGGSNKSRFARGQDAVDALHTSVMVDSQLTKPKHEASMHKRWDRHCLSLVANENDPGDKSRLREQIETAAISFWESITIKGEVSSRSNVAPLAEQPSTMQSNASDFDVIWQWCFDKLMLRQTPALYLFPEEKALPKESLRTFYVDEKWMNCLLDGALSVAKHSFYTESDDIRIELKKRFNSMLRSEDNRAQVPSWGFLLRSKIVEVFPDLRIQAPWPDNNVPRAEVARMEILAPDTLLCLFDRRPDDGQFTEDGITLTQPPHQQHFSVGDELDDKMLSLTYKMLVTTGKKIDQQEANELGESGVATISWKRGCQKATTNSKDLAEEDLPAQVYDWDTQCLIFPEFAESCWRVPAKIMRSRNTFNIKEANPSLTGIQLNDMPLAMQLRFPKSERKQYAYRSLPVPPARDPTPPPPSKSFIYPDEEPRYYALPRPRLMPPPSFPTLQPATIFMSARTIAETPDIADIASKPLTISYLSKTVFPLLLRDRNIPTLSRHPLDLVFNVKTVADLAKLDLSLVLLSVTLILPAGTDAADLLRVTPLEPGLLTILPSSRSIAKGRRWLAVLRETKNKKVLRRFRADLTAGIRQKLPSACLVVMLSPRGKPERLLSEGPDLSFLLETAEINGVPGKGKIVFEEVYARKRENGEVEEVGRVTGSWAFEKEKAKIG